MTYLFIDTANSFIISIIKDGKILYYHNDISNSDTSAKIMPVIDEAFKTSCLNCNDIDKIYVVNGPGSFTGIRVGVTVAKIMAYLLNKPLISLSELELMSTTLVSTRYVISAIDARRGYVYGGIYDNNLNNYYEDYVLLEELKSKLSDDYTMVETSENIDLLKLIHKHENDKPINPHELKPNYLKKTEAEERLNDQRNE